jgi:hypothetical protein
VPTLRGLPRWRAVTRAGPAAIALMARRHSCWPCRDGAPSVSSPSRRGAPRKKTHLSAAPLGQLPFAQYTCCEQALPPQFTLQEDALQLTLPAQA